MASIGTCVYSSQAGNEMLLSAVRSGRVSLVRQMYEIDKSPEAFDGLSRLIVAAREAPSKVDIHVCLWTAKPTVAPKTINISDVTSVGLFNEVDLRYGWQDYPSNFNNAFYGYDGRPVTNFPYRWAPNIFNPFNGSARWSLGIDEWTHRHAIVSEKEMPKYNSSGITRAQWINKSTIFTSYIDLHIYGATTPESVATMVDKQLRVWDANTLTYVIPFFIGELGPHSTHQIVWDPQKVADWVSEVDSHLKFVFGDRYRGSCWHGPNHLQFLSHIPTSEPVPPTAALNVVRDIVKDFSQPNETAYCPGCGYTSPLRRPMIRRNKKATCRNCGREWRKAP